MSRTTSKKGFTLLETIIAISIAVGVLSASVATNRVIQNNIVGVKERAQMNALADESLEMLRGLRNTAMTATPRRSLGEMLNAGTNVFSATSASADTSMYGAFYATAQGANQIENGGDIKLNWCPSTSTACTTGLVAPMAPVVGVLANPGHSTNPTISCGTDPATAKLGNMFACVQSTYGAPGEVVALRRSAWTTSPAVANPNNRQVVDVSNPILTGSRVLLSDTANYSFYVRQIQITRQGSATTTISASGSFSNSIYIAQVTITNANNPEFTLTKKILLTDWFIPTPAP